MGNHGVSGSLTSAGWPRSTAANKYSAGMRRVNDSAAEKSVAPASLGEQERVSVKVKSDLMRKEAESGGKDAKLALCSLKRKSRGEPTDFRPLDLDRFFSSSLVRLSLLPR